MRPQPLERPEQAPWLKPDERACMVRHLSEYEAQKKAQGEVDRASLWETLKNRDVLALMLAFGFSGWIGSTFTFFIPTLLKRASARISLPNVGFVLMGPYIVYAIVAQTWDATRTRPKDTGTASCRFWSLSSESVLSDRQNPWHRYAAICLIQAGTASFFVNFWPTANPIAGKSTNARSIAYQLRKSSSQLSGANLLRVGTG